MESWFVYLLETHILSTSFGDPSRCKVIRKEFSEIRNNANQTLRAVEAGSSLQT